MNNQACSQWKKEKNVTVVSRHDGLIKPLCLEAVLFLNTAPKASAMLTIEAEVSGIWIQSKKDASDSAAC